MITENTNLSGLWLKVLMYLTRGHYICNKYLPNIISRCKITSIWRTVWLHL